MKQEVMKVEKALCEVPRDEIMKMVAKFETLKVIPGDKKSYDLVKSAKNKFVHLRNDIDKNRKQLNGDAQQEIKDRNALAKELVKLFSPAEDHLALELKTEDDRIKEIEEVRINQIQAMITTITNHGTLEYSETSEDLKKRIDIVEGIDIDDRFEEFGLEAENKKKDVLARLNDAFDKRVIFEKEEAERKAEAERLAKQKAEQEAAQKKIDEENKRQEKARKAEETKLKEEREAIEKEKAEIAEQKKQAKINRLTSIGLTYSPHDETYSFGAITYDHIHDLKDDIFDKEIKVIINTIEAEKTRLKKEKEEKEAKIKADAEKAAREKLEREQKKKEDQEKAEAEKERKRIARMPDKKKLESFAELLEHTIISDNPELKTDEAKNVLEMFQTSLNSVISTFKSQVEKL